MSQIEILSLTHYSEHRYQQLREIYITTKDGCFNTSCCFYFVVMHQRQNEYVVFTCNQNQESFLIFAQDFPSY